VFRNEIIHFFGETRGLGDNDHAGAVESQFLGLIEGASKMAHVLDIPRYRHKWPGSAHRFQVPPEAVVRPDNVNEPNTFEPSEVPQICVSRARQPSEALGDFENTSAMAYDFNYGNMALE
jgi:hypothetical protein